MATQSINFSGSGDARQETETITMAAGERLRIRFSNVRDITSAKLKLVANSFTNEIDIFNYGDSGEALDAWASDNFADGDVVSLVAELGGGADATLIGIMESF